MTRRLEALVFSAPQFALGRTALIDELATQPVAGRAALAEAVFDQPALAPEHFDKSSRLYSAAITRLTPLTMVETGLPSFSNCSAQNWTLMPASLQMNSDGRSHPHPGSGPSG